MSRKLADLIKEVDGLHIVVSTGIGKKVRKEDYEIVLRDFYWQQDHPGESIPLQLEPQAAHNIKDLDVMEVIQAWADTVPTIGFAQQEKLNGARFVMFIGLGSNRFTSRRKSDKTYLFSDKTNNFPYHRDFDLSPFAGTVLDGEMKSCVSAVDTGAVKTVSELQATIAITNSSPEKAKEIQDKFGVIKYHIFDMLWDNGMDIRHLPYHERLRRLYRFEVASNPPSNLFEFIDTFYIGKRQRYDQWVKEGKEGCMLKDLMSPYEEGKRTWSWLKCKRFEEVDAIVTGFDRGASTAAYCNMVGDLQVSCYDESGVLREIAAVSAMPLEMRKAISVYDLEKDEVSLRPDIYNKIVVVRFQDITKNLRGQHAVMQEQNPLADWEGNYFRQDKNEKDCVFKFKAAEEKLKLLGRF